MTGPDRGPVEQTGYGAVDRPYRQTAVGLALLGLLAAGLVFAVQPGERQDILIAFAGVGLFGALLLYFLRPTVTAETDPAERVYRALAGNADALIDDADLSDRHVYLPTTYEKDGFTPVALYVPDSDQGEITIDRNRRPLFDGATVTVPDDAAGVTLYPTGGALFDAFEGLVVSELSTDPIELAAQLTDGVRLGLLLAEDIDIEVDAAAGTATAVVSGPRFGPATEFDHPVVSFLAVGFAVTLDVPVVTRCEPSGERTYRVTYQWSNDQVGSGDSDD
ncbi:putative membrane anchored protein with Ig-like domain [Halapricum desulfuricans]|uniref:Putative membrane anchored protein with Ig-like domain n=1 Tax=Halapricum desulfuricans TaxID=2841257 RepID=A0A897NK62_9EURY|nr:hypothetical protein [Halapricum desulfuricans]QSG11343.1 putative membrane anchored protein with Ig-like domain [Halapricum desulfuricans]